MAYVSVSDWRPEQVTEWLKGLDSCLLPYLHSFSNNEINGQQLLNLCPDELTHLGVTKIGHQELVLEGVELLSNFHFELDRENLQAFALRVSCASHSLHNELKHQADQQAVPTQIMSDVTFVVKQVKGLVSWLDRAPFSGQLEYSELKPQLLSLCLKMALSAQRDKFADSPIMTIRDCSARLAKLADSVIQNGTDPMILQPAYLDLATLKKRAGEDLGFFMVPSFHGEHLVGEMKLSSPAHQSGKIQPGDEIVQVNYQTVVGWARKKVLALIEESPNDLLLTLKRRPRHVKMYGQMYMKPYRLPSRKRAAPYSRWNDNLPSPRPEFLTIPHFEIPSRSVVETKPACLEDSVISSSSDEEFPLVHSTSPTSMRLYLPKPRAPIQRRFTLSGPPKPSAQTEQFWRELQLERSWRSNQNNSQDAQKDDDDGVPSGMPMREKSVSVGVACNKIGQNSAIIDAKSIIELNKVKRDAFFSNMGCAQKPTPPRGRLDKSRSTPAYDLGEPEPKDHPPQPTPRNASKLRQKPWEYEEAKADVTQETIEPEHGQMVNTINQTLRRDPDDDAFFTDIPPAPREIRPIPAQRKFTLPPAPLPPKPKPRPLPPEPVLQPAQSFSLPTTPSSPPAQSTIEKERTKNTLDHLKAMWTLGRSNSPRAARKQNPTLARRRQVALKDLLPGDVSGVLWHRHRKGAATWTQGFFLLQGPAFYGFRQKDWPRADLFIYLPGFTCSIAEEVKSKNNAFKIYHTGTVFYFAAETEEEMQQWLDGANLATTSMEENRSNETPGWSETDSDSSDTDQPPDSCFPTGQRVSRLLGAPARSHQNLASDSAKCVESPRKFSSLKKFNKSNSHETTDAASLDRKYLRFLTQKNTPVPVPTSQFRSYRRMQPPPAAPPRPVTNRAEDNARSPPTRVTAPETFRRNDGMDPPRLARRTLHSSNPSLINPEMADYRMTQERLREFRHLRSQGRPVDLSGFMTLEQFMLSRQEEERNFRSSRHARTRVYPSQNRDPDGSRNNDSNEKPQVAPRSNATGVKPKLQFTGSSSSSSHSLAQSTDDSSPGDVSRGLQMTTALPEYPGIEYPPAFEPETYTLQYMLKNRRKRDAAQK